MTAGTTAGVGLKVVAADTETVMAGPVIAGIIADARRQSAALTH